jgi:hypothetical protein
MDYALESTFDVKFTSRIFATGVPGTLAGSPVVEIYEDNGITQITAAETLTVDFDSVTGLNNLRIVATAANGFEAGKSYSAVISAGTVSGVSVVGEVVCNFSIQRQPVNWANVTAPTTAVDLSATDIQLCDTVTTNTDMITVGAVADAVLDEAMSGHTTAGSLGLFLNDQYDLAITGITTGVETRAGKHSVAGTVMMSTNAALSGGTLTAKKPSDDSTFSTYSVSTDSAANNITGVS